MNATAVGLAEPAPIPDRDELSREMGRELGAYLAPLLILLDQRLDRRLVVTLAQTVLNVIRRRGRDLNLLLCELGEQLLDGAHAPAGVKRLWRLLRSPKWTADLVHDWLLEEADAAVERAISRDGDAYLVLDGSVIEKPTAKTLEGLTKVRSVAARLLRRASGGPPVKPPILVPGFNWLGAVVTGLTGSLTLARLHWYSPKAPDDQAEGQRDAEKRILFALLERWGQRVLCLLDRGFDSREFLGELLVRGARIIVRWRKDYHLVGPDGQEARASRLTQRLRSACHVELYSPYERQSFTVGLVAVPVTLVGNPTPLWLVAVRRKRHETIWLLSTEEAKTKAQLIGIVRAYARRWQVEWAFRFGKTDLGLASIRVRLWEYRQKLWCLAELAHAYLLHLLVLDEPLRKAVLRWCHRTGRKWDKVVTPLYRLRHALANLWQDHPPTIAWPPPQLR